MKLNKAISQRIESLLTDKEMTQYALFKASGVPRPTLSNVMNCTYDSVKLRVIHEICLGLDISLIEFFNSPLFDIQNLDDD